MLQLVQVAVANVVDPIDVTGLEYRNRDILRADLRALPTWLLDHHLLIAALQHLGWVDSTLSNYAAYNIYYVPEEGPEYDRNTTETMHRALPSTPSRTVAFTLTQLGRPTRWDQPEVGKSCASETVVIKGLRTHPKSVQVALCEKIVVEGFGALPFLLSEEGFQDAAVDGFAIETKEKCGLGKNAYTSMHTPCIVFAGTAGEFSQWFVKNQDWAIRFIVVAQHQRDDLGEYDWLDHDDLDPDAVLRDVLTEVSAFDPKLAAARQAYYDADDALHALDQIHQRANDLERIAQSPQLHQALGSSGRKFQRKCDALTQALQKNAEASRRKSGTG